MRRLFFLSVAVASSFAVLSCEPGGLSSSTQTSNPYKRLEVSTKSAEMIEAGHTFSLEFIDRVNAAAEGDYFVSPLSLQFLLGMLLDGARGDTADEISQVLGYGAGEVEAVNQCNQSLLRQLPDMDKQTTLNIANALFVNKQISLLDGYRRDVEQYYKAGISSRDFTDTQGTLKAINDWCSEQTNGLIPKILDKINPDILAYLLNAVYFKSQWKEKFSKSATAEEDFTAESGAKGKVKMMRQEKEHSYRENEVFQAVSLPYGNNVYSMYVFLPKEGKKVADIVASLKTEGWSKNRKGMDTYKVDLWLPKFETKYSIQLNDVLSGMGMPTAFDGDKADFKGMVDQRAWLDFVKQDAAIKVDEEGTEAAAVSSAGVNGVMSPGPPEKVVFHADHPFLYLIAESSTGAILFAGRYSGK